MRSFYSKCKVCGYTAHLQNMNRMIEVFKKADISFERQVEVGAVIGTHAGPDASAAAYFVKK